MKTPIKTTRIKATLPAAFFFTVLFAAAVAAAQERPAQQTPAPPPMPQPAPGFVTPKTPWGDPDLQGFWPGVDMVGAWAEKVGLDVALARELTEAILVRQVDWVSAVSDLHEAGARWILDLGPGDILTRLTAPVIRGLGIGIVPAATRGGQRNLFTTGAVPE